jgi:hypothetical protein
MSCESEIRRIAASQSAVKGVLSKDFARPALDKQRLGGGAIPIPALPGNRAFVSALCVVGIGLLWVPRSTSVFVRHKTTERRKESQSRASSWRAYWVSPRIRLCKQLNGRLRARVNTLSFVVVARHG